jgi:hypothetical protein
MPPMAAAFLLKSLKKYWYDYPDKQDDVKSWYSVVRKLIKQIRLDDKEIKLFCQAYPHLLVSERVSSTFRKSKKTQALIWKRIHRPADRLVQDSFTLLGYETIEEAYKKAGGYNITREPTDKETALLAILEHTAKEVLDGFILNYPEYKIINNDSSVYSGTASMSELRRKQYNEFGYAIKYNIHYLELRHSLFTADTYAEAFSTYCHELCHCFGGDSSSTFSRALTKALELTFKENKSIKQGEKSWKQCFLSKSE